MTDLVDLSKWPPGTRLIIRREPLHPGAQASLFPSLDYRYSGHYTDQRGTPVTRDVFMRGHANVEDGIGRLKDSGLLRFPFTDLQANRAWLAEVCFAHDLARWFQRLCLSGDLASAEPKTLRWRLRHTPAQDPLRAPDDRPHPRRMARRSGHRARPPAHGSHYLNPLASLATRPPP